MGVIYTLKNGVLEKFLGNITLDSQLNINSNNGVKNSVLTAKFNEINSDLSNVESDITYEVCTITANDSNVSNVVGRAKIDRKNKVVYVNCRFVVTDNVAAVNALIKIDVGGVLTSDNQYGGCSIVNDAGGSYSTYVNFHEAYLYLKARIATPAGAYTLNGVLLYD